MSNNTAIAVYGFLFAGLLMGVCILETIDQSQGVDDTVHVPHEVTGLLDPNDPNAFTSIVAIAKPTTYQCPKHGTVESALSFYIDYEEKLADYCPRCLIEVMDRAGICRVVVEVDE